MVPIISSCHKSVGAPYHPVIPDPSFSNTATILHISLPVPPHMYHKASFESFPHFALLAEIVDTYYLRSILLSFPFATDLPLIHTFSDRNLRLRIFQPQL